MKLIVTADAANLEAAVSRSLSRARHVLLVDSDTLAVEDLTDEVEDFAGPSFLIVARLAARRGVDGFVSGRVRPPLIGMLYAQGIAAYEFAGTVRQAVEAAKAGKLERAFIPGFAGFGAAVGEAFGEAFAACWPEGPWQGRRPHHPHAERMWERAQRKREMWGDWRRPGPEGRSEAGAEPAGAEPATAAGAPTGVESEVQALRQQAEELRRQLDEVLKRVEQLESK
jgi:predicted Fe-Mo cluster-binding NifX family protein